MKISRRQVHSRRGTRRKAALLLEVVVAFGIVTAALGMLGAQLSGGLQMVQYAEQQTRASELADRILALLELDQTLQQQIFVDNKTDGDFGTEYPGWFWRILVEPTETVGLGMVSLEILFDAKLGTDVAAARPVRQLHMLKADPGRINLETDFGFTQDQVTQLTEQIQIPGFDPNQLDPQALVSMPPEQLLLMLGQLLPLLQQLAVNAGINPDQIPQTPEDAAGLLNNLSANGVPGAGGKPGSQDGGGGDLAPDPGKSGGGRNPSGGGATLEDLLRLRDQGAGGGNPSSGVGGRTGEMGPPRRGGAGNSAGAGNSGGAGNRGNTPSIRPGSLGGGGTNVGGNRGGGNRAGAGNSGSSGGGSSGSGANRPAGGGNRSGAGSGGGQGQQHYTIEDLMRLRDGQPINR